MFLEIEPDSSILDTKQLKSVAEKLDALVIIHIFGNSADKDFIKKIMRDKVIIEYCAHAISSKYKNRLGGTIGDTSFFL